MDVTECHEHKAWFTFIVIILYQILETLFPFLDFCCCLFSNLQFKRCFIEDIFWALKHAVAISSIFFLLPFLNAFFFSIFVHT